MIVPLEGSPKSGHTPVAAPRPGNGGVSIPGAACAPCPVHSQSVATTWTSSRLEVLSVFLNWVQMEPYTLSSGVWLLSLSSMMGVRVVMLVPGAVVCAFPSPDVPSCEYTTHPLSVPLLMGI